MIKKRCTVWRCVVPIANHWRVPVAIISAHIVVTGGNPHRLHEKITVSGGDLKENGFARITEVGRLNSPSEKFQAFRVR
jgi:organic radical activating enzyme